MRKFVIFLGVVLAALAVAVVFLFSSPNALDMFKSHETITDAKVTNSMVLGYVGNPYTDDYQNARIPGYMQNNSKLKVAAVKLEIDLYNGKGDRKEIVKYTVENILPGQRKSFDANAGTLDGPRNAKVKVLSVEVVK